MNYYKNKPTDIKVKYAVEEYEKLEKLFNLGFHELALMLALTGYIKGECLPLDSKDDKNLDHTFSRTNYSRSETEFDAFFGLLSILENEDKDYDEVINNIAFEKTEKNNLPFAKLPNVQTFFGYLLSGSKHMYDIVFKNGSKSYDIADSIHDFLTSDISKTLEIIDALLLEELSEEIEANV